MKPGEAIAARRANSVEASDLTLEASPLYDPLAELAREGFTGTVAELGVRLDSMVSEAMRRSVRWPKAPTSWATRLGAWPPISAPRESSSSSAVRGALNLERNVATVADHLLT
jgi:hypothetical protein